MITCTPRGICSWNYELHGDGGHAIAEFDWAGEQGRLTVNQENLSVAKHGFFSGRWSLDSKRGTIMTAQKSSAFTRTFEISGLTGKATLSASSAFGRTMIFKGYGVDCLISPAHPFTRRATIHGSWDDFRQVSFAFWLSALVWRRAARNNAGHAGS